VLLLEYDRVPLAFILASPELGLEGIKEFLKVCLGDFHNHFPTLDLTATRETRFAGAPVAAGDGAAGGQRLSSYTSIALTGRNDQTIGSMHLGHRANNYFTEKLNDNINLFALNAGIILDNSILFNQTAQMHTRVRQAFAKFVPEEIIADLIAERQGDERLVGEKRVVTVLFADIRGFTAISENNSAESTVAFLNNYFKIMVAIINRHGGTIDKFIGDAILAVFGAPTSYEDNTPRAVRAAREMIGALPQVAVDRLAIPDGRLYIGVGIHEGEVIVGNIGSADKFDYTVIGDTVNLASRLEGLTKYYQQPIIVSESVRKRLDRDIPCLELDTVRVMGKENATNIYAILPDESDHDAEFMGHFSKALKMYRMGNWSTAAEYFDRALQRQPRDRSTAIFLERCAAYQADPPPQWDGSMVLDFK
jgi:class 3 adenylate cyclase